LQTQPVGEHANKQNKTNESLLKRGLKCEMMSTKQKTGDDDGGIWNQVRKGVSQT
jgi:hypothetical protein